MSLRGFIFSLSVLSFGALAACGGGVASSSGGDGGCLPVPIHCANHCRYGVVGSDAPLCENGQWVCPSPGPVCVDGGANGDDASSDADAARDAPGDVVALDAASIACGPTLVCTNATQFCQESSGGPPPPPDAGSGVGYGCEQFPSTCATNHSCACLRASGACGGGLVDCRETGAGIIVSCAFP